MRDKLEFLSEAAGYDSVDSMIMNANVDGAVPAVCTNELCKYTTETDPCQSDGWCPECDTPTVVSCMVLIDVI